MEFSLKCTAASHPPPCPNQIHFVKHWIIVERVLWSLHQQQSDFFIVILPQSALEMLSNYNIGYPMIFKLVNNRTGRQTHCGVLEFSAREGLTYLPGWVFFF
jgi:hypothetical protein